ncbi:helix-turn-helix domain-containing protein [Neosynechococcus sphagnicola]|uniref:helix-turn-helix domain-containing protein n=1 Tax=Neosynechococcus sphagnicola TaxID=1501145 RepID=UPI0012DFF8AD
MSNIERSRRRNVEGTASRNNCTATDARSCLYAALKRSRQNVPMIAKLFECHEHTVRPTIKRWQAGGFSGLWEATGRGHCAVKE